MTVTLDPSLYFQTTEGGEIKQATVDGIKDLSYAKLAKGAEISFDGNGGRTAEEETSYTQGFFLNQESQLKTNAFTKENYNFDGWKEGTQTYADGASFTLTQPPTETRTLTAEWKPMSWSVVLDPCGGTIAAGKDVTTYTYGTEVTLPTDQDITRRGYSFQGWYDNADYTGDPVTSLSSGTSGDKHYYAKWEAGKYKVTFDKNGADGGEAMSSLELSYGEGKKPLPENTYRRTGYRFVAWNTEADGSGSSFSDKAEVEDLSEGEPFKLYAIWEIEVYQLTYDLDGGTLEAENPTSYTTEQDLTIHNPAKEGYLFKGWTDQDSDQPVITYRTKGKTGDKTLTAVWEELVPDKTYYSVNFDSVGGSDILSQTVEEGEKAERPADPEREGYTFLEWQKDGETFDFSAPITADITLTAVWMQQKSEDDGAVVEKHEITVVPDSIQKAHPDLDLSTPKKLNDFMLKEVTELFSTLDVTVEEIERKQTYESYDVDLKITITRSDGTTEVVKVTEDNYESLIPAGGIDTILPYPAAVESSGNNVEYTYAGVHVCEHNFGQYKAGDVEKLDPVPTEKGLLVHLSGLSPVMITWQEKAKEDVEPVGPDVDPVKPVDPDKKPVDPDKSKDQSGASDQKDKPREKTLLERIRESLAATPAHVCQDSDFQWETKEGTETEDGYMEYKCRKCGNIKYSVPISAYYTFNRNVSEKIRKAAAGSTVEVATPVFVSFHEMVKDALLANPDVTVKVNYRYQGKFYDMIIPAGRTKEQLDTLWNGTKFCGFRNMASQFVTTQN